MKSNLKKTLASVAAVCIASSMMIPMGASAGQMLGQTDFENGICLPWHTCESATAKMEFDIDGGSFNVTIVEPGGEANGGEDRWDCQVRHRGLNMQAGQKYRLSFELTPSNSGEFYTKIGNLNGDVEVWHNGSHDSSDFGQFWNPIQVSANQTYSMEVEFTPTETVEVAEWAFHLGGGGSVTGTTGKVCFPAGTVIKFDNMSLECLTSDEWDYVALAKREMSGISLNQVGYYANRTKKATIDTGLISGTDFTINDANGGVVYSGTLGSAKADADSGNTVAVADFSEVRTAGTYTLTVGGVTSDPFQVFDSQGGTYKEMTKDALNYFFLNRGNQNTESKYISGAYADETVTYNNKPIYNSVEEHAEALTITGDKVRDTDSAYIQDIWKNDYAFNGSDVITTKGSIDVTGGWYDAGDYGKYVVNGGISVWTLQNIYERAMANGTTDVWASGSDYMYIPESDNSTPDVLDEAAVELDWFIDSMQRDDGMVYHKTHDYKWTALATLPSQDVGPDGKTKLIRIVKPVTYAATLNLAATGAQGYRVWKDIDSAKAEKYLAAAEKAYDAAKKLYDSGAETDPTTSDGASLYAPLDQSVGGGPYGDTEVSDDFYWAACELFAATGDSKYETDLKSYGLALEVVTSLDGGENSGSLSSFNWGCTASLGTLSLALNTMGTVSDADVQSAKASTIKAAQTYIKKENEQGYGIPYQQATYTDKGNTITGYEWGSNSFVVNNAIVMAYAYDFTGDGDYVDGVTTAMDYLLGRNPMENSYVTGYGTFYTRYVHHRYWSFLIDPEFPLAPAGVLSGGPNSGVQDPYAKGAGYKPGETAPQKAYIDHIEAWSTNECTINWNAPLSWVVSFMEDTYDAPVGDGDLGGDITDNPNDNPDKPNDTTTSATDGKVDITDTSLELEVGEDKTLSVSGDVDKFESSDPSVATVDSTGKVTGIAKGEATITVTGKDGSTDTITVTVTEGETSGDVTTPAQSGDTTTATDTDVTTSDDVNVSDSVTTPPAIDENNKWGDVDCNGEVNAVDVLMLKKYLLTMLTAEDIGAQGMANADVTHDGDVTAPDLVKLKKFVLTMIEESDLAVSGS